MEVRDLQGYVEAAAEAARRAGAVLEQWRQRFQVTEKGRFDLVTEADVASQEAIQSFLSRRYPEFGFIGEERANAPRVDVGKPDRPTWIVDPLDGTTNYVHGCPMFAVSIGLVHGAELLAGVIYDPNRQELFRAARGQEAWLGKQRLRTTVVSRLEDALLSASFPPDMNGQEHMLAAWRHFSLRTQSVRRTGSTALNLAYVAAGRFDAFWAYEAHLWDAAAGSLLIQEAGGMVSNLDGSLHDLKAENLVASNGPLHPALIEGLRTSGCVRA